MLMRNRCGVETVFSLCNRDDKIVEMGSLCRRENSDFLSVACEQQGEKMKMAIFLQNQPFCKLARLLLYM